MDNTLYYPALELVNAVLASLVFCALVYRGRLYFEAYDMQQKLLYIAFTLYALAVAYASVEVYSMDIESGLRIYPFIVADLIALYAFVFYRKSVFARIKK